MDSAVGRFLHVERREGYGTGKRCGLILSQGNGLGEGTGHNNGDGNGNGGERYTDDQEYGLGSGNGSGDGDGRGSSYFYNHDNADTCGIGYGVKSVDGHALHIVGGVPTAIYSVSGDLATGATVTLNSILEPCHIARLGDSLAHGSTPEEAMENARECEEWRKQILDLEKDNPTT